MLDLTAQRQQKLRELEEREGLPSGLLDAVWFKESRRGKNLYNQKSGAEGDFQFIPDTAKAYKVNVKDFDSSADGAARMYADLHRQYKGDVPKMLAGYNWGSGNMQKHGFDNMPAETRDYINTITSMMGGGQSAPASPAAPPAAVPPMMAALERVAAPTPFVEGQPLGEAYSNTDFIADRPFALARPNTQVVLPQPRKPAPVAMAQAEYPPMPTPKTGLQDIVWNGPPQPTPATAYPPQPRPVGSGYPPMPAPAAAYPPQPEPAPSLSANAYAIQQGMNAPKGPPLAELAQAGGGISFDDIPDAAPAISFDDLPDEPQAAAAPQPSGFDRAKRAWDIGLQGVGRGAANLVGMPVDLTTGVMNAGIEGINLFKDDPLPHITNPVAGSDWLADKFSKNWEAGGGEIYDKSEMSGPEKLGYNVNTFGTEAFGGGAALAKKAATSAASKLPNMWDAFLEAYRANPQRALAVDTAAGVGSGAGVDAAESLFPDNPIANLIGSLLGGSAGATGGGAMVSGKQGAESVVKGFTDGFSFDKNIAKDPAMGTPVTHKAANRAAEHLQGEAANLPQAKANLEQNAQWYKDNNLPMPGTGALSDDVGLIGAERAARTEDPTPFLLRDREVKQAQSDKLKNMAPEVQNPRAAQEFAQGEANKQMSAAEQAAADVRTRKMTAEQQADAAAAEEVNLSAPIVTQRGGKPSASEALDREIVGGALEPKTKAKNEAFDAVPNVERDATPITGLVQSIKAQANKLDPQQALPSELVAKLDALAPDVKDVDGALLDAAGNPIKKQVNEGGTGKVGFKDLQDLRKYLNTAAEKARSAGNFELADNLKALKGEINNEADRLIASGGPGSAEAAAAKKMYEEEYAPLFAEGFGRTMRDKIQKDSTGRTALPASKIADHFIAINSPAEAAADLKRISAAAKNPAAAEAAVGNYFKAQIASMVKGDTIEPATLRKFLDNQKAQLENFPAAKAELETIYRNVLNGRGRKNALTDQVRGLANQLKQAEGNVGATQRRIDESVLRTLIDAEPQNAAASILGHADPEKRMDEVLKTIGPNKDAIAAFRRSVADHLEHKMTGTRTEQTGTEDFAVLQSKVEAFMKKPGVEKALGKLYADTPDAMNSLKVAQRIGRDMAKTNIQATAGSPTAENARRMQSMNTLEAALKLKFGMLKGGGLMRSLKLAMGTIPGLNNDDAVRRLIIRAQLEPELALHLYGRNVEKMPARLWTAKLNRLIGYSEAGRESADDDSSE